ncbi:MAG: PDDEXK nuclease domain-containing protein, partial [Patescibacteria group bacterium]
MEKIKNNNYHNLLQELRGIIEKGQYQAYKVVDNILVETRWQMGERIVREELKYQDRADYGKYLVNNLAIDLNIRKQRLSEIIRFYKCYPIVRSLTGQLSWTHYVELIQIENEQERKFYETKTTNNSWSVKELTKQIKNQLYQKTDNQEIKNTFKTALPALTNIQNIFKPVYNLDFLTINPTHQEKELESKIINKIELFLKELGPDFMFLGRQVPILIDNEKHFIDLVLYHRGIPCVVLVDLKKGKLDSRDVGQMNKYLGYYRNNKQYVFEQDAIGLIICKEAGHEEVTYA